MNKRTVAYPRTWTKQLAFDLLSKLGHNKYGINHLAFHSQQTPSP
jgi:hypothetical protein